KKYIKTAVKTCEFLLENTYKGDHFSFIGCKGWYERGETRANFDQQPIEAAGMVHMFKAAYDATQDERFLTLQRKAFDWFLGRNDLRIPLYDFRTKGCNDGLTPDGVNTNQGAESTLSFLLSLLAIVESYAIIDKKKDADEIITSPIDLIGQIVETSQPAPEKQITVETSQKPAEEVT
ncbi:MAG: hypothetical protein JXM79_16235, partial [Sedimentisphaerales bacterium]|nr:hypothetical protein [Sedimentisphaerales bacterium]